MSSGLSVCFLPRSRDEQIILIGDSKLSEGVVFFLCQPIYTSREEPPLKDK